MTTQAPPAVPWFLRVPAVVALSVVGAGLGLAVIWFYPHSGPDEAFLARPMVGRERREPSEGPPPARARHLARLNQREVKGRLRSVQYRHVSKSGTTPCLPKPNQALSHQPREPQHT